MRIGFWRGVTLAIALTSAMGTARTASADGFHDTIPREVLARDLNTGDAYFAPPVPWGHYAKDGLFDHYFPKAGHLGGLCGHGLLNHGCKGGGGGRGSGGCGKSGCGLFNHGCKGAGLGGSGGCGKSGCGLFNHGCKGGGSGGMASGSGSGGGDPGCGLGHGNGHGRRIKDCGLCKGKGCGVCRSSEVGSPMFIAASDQSRVGAMPASAPVASSQCGDPGCGFGNGHSGLHGSICDGCVGKGCGKCGGKGLLHGHGGGHGMSAGNPACDSCGGRGCGKCGLFGGKGACDTCGGRGCGKCGLFGKGGCGFCGGKGCGKCGLGGIGSHMKGKVFGLLHPHAGNIKWFVGPGGPVPLTPGYTPYVVTTRSPRDFLAFPPYTPSEP